MFKLRTAIVAVMMLLLMLPVLSYAKFTPGKAATATQGKAKALGLIVKFKPEVEVAVKKNDKGVETTGLANIDKLNSMHGITRVESLEKKANATIINHPLKQVFVLKADDQKDYAAFVSDYKKSPLVEYAEPDYVTDYCASPNDPHYNYQWNLYNTGQLHPHVDGNQLVYVTGTANCDIKADPVFQNPPDNTTTVIVAMIDSGLDTQHPDIAANVWTNPGEIAGNGLDDDNNGYVDDIHGWDLANGDNTIGDVHGHGTHCAGIIASIINNSIGIAGVCPSAKIMPVELGRAPTMSNLATGLCYATDLGADVASLSIAWSDYSNFVEDALIYAYNRGMVVFAAAANDGNDHYVYPAMSDYVITIGATDDDDHIASWSNFGDHLDLVAPGVDILSLRAAGTDYYGDGLHIIDNQYYLSNGTSMASPMAASVGVYMRAVSPGLSPASVRSVMTQAAKDLIDPYGDGSSYPGWDKYSGYGRVDLNHSLQDTPRLKAMITSPLPGTVSSSASIIIQGTANGVGFQNYKLEYGEGYLPTSWTQITYSLTPVTNGQLGLWYPGSRTGPYTIRLKVNESNFEMVSVFLAPNSIADITFPGSTTLIVKATAVRGTAYCADFDHYTLAYKPAQSSNYTLISTFTKPIEDNLLGNWNTSSLTNGYYDLRLQLFSSVAMVGFDVVRVNVTAQSGGNIKFVDLSGYPWSSPNFCDYDNDGNREIIIGTEGGIDVFNPNGTCKTSGMPSFPSGKYLSSVAIGTFDGDRVDDIATLRLGADNTNGNEIYGYRSSGGPFIIGLPSINLRGEAQSEATLIYMMLKDVDKDNIDEIFLKTPYLVIHYKVGQTQPIKNIEVEGFSPADLNKDTDIEFYISKDSDLKQYDKNWNYVRTVSLNYNGMAASKTRLSTYDIDNDKKQELILLANYFDDEWRVWAFNEGLNSVTGWPHNTGINAQAFGCMQPVFGDIDENGELDYIISTSTLETACLHAWHIDGTTYMPNSSIFACLPFSSVITAPLLTDISGDGLTDVIVNANNGYFGPNPGHRLVAWNASGQMLTNFPIELSTISSWQNMYTPLINDIDKDGYVDIVAPISTSGFSGQLFIMGFDPTPFDKRSSPATMLNFHRNFDNWAPSYRNYICGDANNDGVVSGTDVTYIIAYVFSGGPAPVPYEAGDANCDGTVNVGDAVYINNFLNKGGPVPCASEGYGVWKKSAPEISLRAKYENGAMVVSISSSIDLAALEFKLDGLVDEKMASLVDSAIQIMQTPNLGKEMIALLDIDGKRNLSAGEYDIVTIPRELKISSAVAYDEGGREFPVNLKDGGEASIPETFALNQNYPNPFNPTTEISFSLPAASNVKLEVFNILGEKVALLANQHFEAGIHKFTWDASKYGSGIYLYRIKAGDYTASKKMTLLK